MNIEEGKLLTYRIVPKANKLWDYTDYFPVKFNIPYAVSAGSYAFLPYMLLQERRYNQVNYSST